MFEAVKTTASPAEIWTIVVVAVVFLAFWLGAVAWADRHPLWRGRHWSELQGPVLGGMHVAGGGRSVAPNREAPSVLTNTDEVPYDQRDYDPEDELAQWWRETPPGTDEPWVPVPQQRGGEPRPTPAPAQQPTEQQTTRQQTTRQQGTEQTIPDMPVQRTSETDQPTDVTSGPGATDQGSSRHSWSRRR
jgi:outer membrane biosynthesis protein TonB